MTDADRTRAESDLGLVVLAPADGRTWVYRPPDRSTGNLRRLVEDPRVEDTGHIDRRRLKVLIDRPDLPVWLRWLIETEQLQGAGLVLLFAGLAAAWRTRATLLAVAGAALRIVRRSPHECDVPRRHRVAVLAGVAVLTTIVLLSNVANRPEDSTFVHLYEATSLLAGDHPYRDFFEWGAPLPMYLSAGGQLLSGNRLIGEMALQWSFIVFGVVIAFHLGLRLSHSAIATLSTVPVTMLVLSTMPTYHYSKLICFPAAVWLAWRYVERPTVRRGAALGTMTTLAFLFRHDYGIWVGLASVLAFLLARVAVPGSRRVRHAGSDCLAYAVAAAISLMPWAGLVQSSEGLWAYGAARADKYERAQIPYHRLLTLDPLLRTLRPAALPPPKAATVVFEWESGVNESMSRQLEREYHLRLLEGRDPEERLRYELPNVYDMRLLALRPFVNRDNGFQWERLDEVQSGRPARGDALLVLEQLTLLVPLLLLASAAAATLRSWWNAQRVPTDALHKWLAGTLLVVIDGALFRESSYLVAVAPFTAAGSACFMAASAPTTVTSLALGGRDVAGRLLRHTGRIVAVALLVLATYAAHVWSGGLQVLRRPATELIGSVSTSLALWVTAPPPTLSDTIQYLRECTGTHDRLLVGGMTPFDVNYYSGVPMAGGHLYWHSGWRSDPGREAESLALLARQSVPFAVSSSDPMMDDFKRYPRIRAYLTRYYVALEGTAGRILVDHRRQPVRTWGVRNYPCFR